VKLLISELCIVPLPFDFIEKLGIPFLPLTDGGDTIGRQLDDLCRSLSHEAELAYVEAEFFGGVGTQGCVLYTNGVPSAPPMVDNEAINHALSWLGVQRIQDKDEFLVADFGMHRNTEDWLKNE